MMMDLYISQANHAHRQMIVPRNMGKKMNRLRNAEKSFCDVTFQTRDGKQLHAHKAVLVSASDYFVTMFSTEMHERYSDVVEMKNMSSDVLETVINFIYDQPILISEENIYELTDAAEYLLVAVPRQIGIIGGRSTQRDLVMFDQDEEEIQLLPEISFCLTYPFAVTNGDNLYVIDGLTSTMKLLNLKDQTYRWEEVTKMPEPKRYQFGCAVLNGFIYVAGGGMGRTAFSSVIKYDLSNNVWSDVKSMSEERKDHALISLEGTLYAIAGCNSMTSILKTVEMYDEDHNDWTHVSSLNKNRSQFAASTFNGRIYVTGGWQMQGAMKSDWLSCVEIYDPNENVWMIMIEELNRSRHRHDSCVVDGKLYVVGGTGVKSIEVYDPKKDEWQICGKLDRKRTFSAVYAM